MQPNAGVFNVGTLGEMRARINRWARESLDRDVVTDAVNDAISSLWQSVIQASLSRFVSPATTVSIPAGATTVPLVSVADPSLVLRTVITPGGALPDRVSSFTYSYATDSGSETKVAPAIVAEAGAGQLFVIQPPDALQGVIGWNLYAGQAGRLCRQNVAPLPFETSWIEPPTGLQSSPNGPWPPAFNTTGDNIASIARLDVSNAPQSSWTNWQQADITSSLFTQMGNRLPSTSTFVPRAYDLIDNRTIEIRPAGEQTVDATLFYFTRPRRLRFDNSLIPYTSFDANRFIGSFALSDILDSLYEEDAAGRWQQKAEQERARIVASIVMESRNRNTRVIPFRA